MPHKNGASPTHVNHISISAIITSINTTGNAPKYKTHFCAVFESAKTKNRNSRETHPLNNPKGAQVLICAYLMRNKKTTTKS